MSQRDKPRLALKNNTAGVREPIEWSDGPSDIEVRKRHGIELSSRHNIRAGRRCPRIEPTRCFCAVRLIGYPERVSHILPGLETEGTFWVGAATSEERLHFDQVSTNRVL